VKLFPHAILAAVALSGMFAGLAWVILCADSMQGDDPAYVARRGAAIPVGVLGDSDSHSYQDRISFPPGTSARGGPYREATLQWTEALARLRPAHVDPGEWGIWGTSRLLSHVQDWLGLKSRAPRKQDYRYDMAISGAGCAVLTGSGLRQVQRLVAQMDREPGRWDSGVVVVRIGVNSFGKRAHLDRLARDPADPEVQALIGGCIAQVRAALQAIHERHPRTRAVLVGIFDNVNWTSYLDFWREPESLANIARGLDAFDSALKELAAQDARLAFFDDRAWFAQHWGTRDASGQPDYRSVVLADGFQVANSQGDEPSNAVVADGHGGLVWNALWAQALVRLLNERFDAGIPPIGDAEIARFVADLRRVGERRSER
jgi:hypothetical protein